MFFPFLAVGKLHLSFLVGIHSMHCVCRLSQRWHQQFYRSPSFAGHQQCLSLLMPSRQYRSSPRGVKHSDMIPSPSEISRLGPKPTTSILSGSRRPSRSLKNELVVHEFEQVGSDATTRVPVKPNKELEDETTYLRSHMQELEKELKFLRGGPFGPQSEFMQSFPKDERERLLKALADEGALPDQEEDIADMAEIDRMFEEESKGDKNTDSLAVTLRIPRAHRAFVERFNKALADAQSGNRDELKNMNLWKWYLRCQQRVPNFSSIVSDEIWNFLWQSQTEFGVRPKHIVMLSQDIIHAGGSLMDEQRIEYIRCLHSTSDVATAIHVWEDQKAQLDPKSNLFSTFYSIGIQLYAALGRPMKAQNVCYQALRNGADPQIAIHVISAWANEKSPEATVKAWAAYLRMRSLLGDTIEPDLYEKVSNSFLDAGQPSMALAVFKDLVAGVREEDSFTLDKYNQAIGSFDQDQDQAELEKKINEVSLATLLVLPKGYDNKYFFSSWIKNLLGRKRVDAASMVVDLMYERNIVPDAIHLNGIIGAWLREENIQSREKAEKLAWDLIHARIKRVQQRANNRAPRQIGNAFRKVIQFEESDNIWLEPIRTERPMPSANTETFSLLFDYNERRSNWKESDHLISLMIGPAQLRPNIFIVNKLLMRELNARLLGRFWQLFNGLKEEIRPNLDTFSLLWRAAGLHFAPRYEADKASSKSYPSSRQIFRDMETWFSMLNKRDANAAIEEFDSDLYAQIVKCFSYQMDIPGALCAMQGLNQLFEASPDDVSARLITGLVARKLPQPMPETPQRRGRGRFNHKLASNKLLLKNVADIIETLEAKHQIALVESGKATPDDVEDDNSDVAGKMRIGVLTELLLMMMKKTKKEGENPMKTLRDVAEFMRVDLKSINLQVDSTL